MVSEIKSFMHLIDEKAYACPLYNMTRDRDPWKISRAFIQNTSKHCPMEIKKSFMCGP
jgi:hypothetical protein